MTELTAALMYSELFAPVAHVDDVANTRSRSQTLPVRRQCARCRPRPHRAHMGRAHRARARAAYDRRGRVAVRHEKHEYLKRETHGRVYTFGCLTTSR
jgi:hypothetical protein